MATSTCWASALPCTRFNRESCENEDGCQHSHAPDTFSLGSGGRNVCLGYLIGRCDGWACNYSHDRGDLLRTDEEIRNAIQERLSLIDMWNGRMTRISAVASLFPSLPVGFVYPPVAPVPAVGYQPDPQTYPTPDTLNSSPPESTEDFHVDDFIVQEEEEEVVIEIAEPLITHKLNPSAMVFIPREHVPAAEPVTAGQAVEDVPAEIVEVVPAEIEDQPNQLDWVVPQEATRQDLELWSSPKFRDTQTAWDNSIAGGKNVSTWDTTDVHHSSEQQSAEKWSKDKQSTKKQNQDAHSEWDDPGSAAESSWFNGPSVADFAEPTRPKTPPKASIASVIDSRRPKKEKNAPEKHAPEKHAPEKKSNNSKKRSVNSPTAPSDPSARKYGNSKLKKAEPTMPVASWAEPDSPKTSKATKERPPHVKANGLDEKIQKNGSKIPLTPGILAPDAKLAEEILRAHEKLLQDNAAAAASTSATPSPAEGGQEEDPGLQWVNSQGQNWDSTPDPIRDFDARTKAQGSTTSWVASKPSRWPSLK